MIVADGLNKYKGYHIKTVMVTDMTSHDELAYGFIEGNSPGKFKIIK